MKTYTIIGGVNGVGKSSLTGVLKALPTDLGVILIEQGNTAECLARNISFTQETTLAGHKTELIAAQAKEQGYYIRLFYIGLNTPGECLARIENRVKRGGHAVPDAAVRRAFEARWDNVKQLLPYCDEALFFDNDNGFVEVAEYRNGEVVTICEQRPDWLKELQTALVGRWSKCANCTNRGYGK